MQTKSKVWFFLIFVLSMQISYANAESGWITDPSSGCTFFNQNSQANETIKFQGTCNKNSAKGKLTWYLNGAFNEAAEGVWLNGKQTGHGTYEYKSGSSYVGSFVDGRRSGKGTYKWVSGNSYEGDFLEGKRTGRGTFKFANGAFYVGDFLNNKMTGRGSLTYPNKTKYVGEFLDGKRHGKGEYADLTGIKYTGDFFEDMESGRGTLVFPEGFTLLSSFSRGEPIGDAVMNTKDGQRYMGRIENGRFVSNDQNLDHVACVRMGFASNTPEYASCRTQIEVAAKQSQIDERAYQARLREMQRQMEEDQRDERMARGLAALGAAARILQPPPPPSNMHTYTFPNGRSMTCNTFGPFTNCN